MSYEKPDALVSTEWLAAHLGDANLRIVDATYVMGVPGRTGAQDYAGKHIPGAVFWDLEAISDKGNPLPVMLPQAEAFAAAVGALGIGNDTQVVVYDNTALLGSARVWWMLRSFGHDKVAVLDGGIGKWVAEGRPTESGAQKPVAAATFTPKPRPELVRDFDAMRRNVDTKAEQVVDARAPGRFNGTDPETRPGSRGGHIPGSVNLPYAKVLTGEHKTFAAPDALKAQYEAAGLDTDKPIAVTCGGGISAPVLALGLHLIGRKDTPVYDASWNEWGTRPDAPVEK